jgi:hypothetical protein
MSQTTHPSAALMTIGSSEAQAPVAFSKSYRSSKSAFMPFTLLGLGLLPCCHCGMLSFVLSNLCGCFVTARSI